MSTLHLAELGTTHLNGAPDMLLRAVQNLHVASSLVRGLHTIVKPRDVIPWYSGSLNLEHCFASSV